MLCPISPHKSVCLISPGQKIWDGRGDPPLPWYVSQGHLGTLSHFLPPSKWPYPDDDPATTSHTHPSVSSPLPNPFLLPPKWGGARKSRKEVQSLHFRLRFRSLSPLFLFGGKVQGKGGEENAAGREESERRGIEEETFVWGLATKRVGKQCRYRRQRRLESKASSSVSLRGQKDRGRLSSLFIPLTVQNYT